MIGRARGERGKKRTRGRRTKRAMKLENSGRAKCGMEREETGQVVSSTC